MPDPATFQILDIESDFAFEFQYFPEQLTTRGRANWEPQDTTIGTKPLWYANTDPMVISIQDAYFDYTHGNVSAEPDIELMRGLMSEYEDRVPPALLAIWGNRRIRCVLTDLTINEMMFKEDTGEPTRLQFSMELMELQDENETTRVSVYNEDVEPG